MSLWYGIPFKKIEHSTKFTKERRLQLSSARSYVIWRLIDHQSSGVIFTLLKKHSSCNHLIHNWSEVSKLNDFSIHKHFEA